MESATVSACGEAFGTLAAEMTFQESAAYVAGIKALSFLRKAPAPTQHLKVMRGLFKASTICPTARFNLARIFYNSILRSAINANKRRRRLRIIQGWLLDVIRQVNSQQVARAIDETSPAGYEMAILISNAKAMLGRIYHEEFLFYDLAEITYKEACTGLAPSTEAQYRLAVLYVFGPDDYFQPSQAIKHYQLALGGGLQDEIDVPPFISSSFATIREAYVSGDAETLVRQAAHFRMLHRYGRQS